MNNQAAQTMPELPPSFARVHNDGYWTLRVRDTAEFIVHDSRQTPAQEVYSSGQMRDMYRQGYAAALSQTAGVAEGGLEAFTDYFVKNYPGPDTIIYDPKWHAPRIFRAAQRAIQAAAPAASGAHPDALPDGTLSKSTAKRVTALAAASVSERARSASLKEIVPAEKRNYLDDNGNPRSIEDEAYAHGWNACRAATLRALEQALTQQRGEVEDEDYHVIMSMGRILAEIAVILKGAEPAGTAWSYHDLPELVKSAVENAHDIASEMRAWAAVKMRERGSSRRDKMMVEEWSKRLLALPEVAFPVKDFDIPGLSITKEEIRFAIRKVVADRVFIGQDFGGTTPQPSADAVREDSARLDWIESQIREYGDGYTEPREAGWGIQWQQERPDHYWPGLRAWIDEERRRASGDELESLLGRGGEVSDVLDPCCGSRMFWFDKQDERATFGDIRSETLTVTDRTHRDDGTRTLTVSPDQIMDFRALPFDDGAFRLVVFDPPHLVKAGEGSWLKAKYGKLDVATWRDDLRAGFAECFRVLAPHGVLIFKWAETQIKVGEILALTPERPLFGHPSGKRAATHWIVFMKEPTP